MTEQNSKPKNAKPRQRILPSEVLSIYYPSRILLPNLICGLWHMGFCLSTEVGMDFKRHTEVLAQACPAVRLRERARTQKYITMGA